MSDAIPSLDTLRALDAVARHGSVTAAAMDLHVTPGAISQRIKLLETGLGVAVLRRTGRGVVFTDAGQGYLVAVREALAQLADATRQLSSAGDAAPLVLSTTSTFAHAWLLPRLQRFRAVHPAIDLEVRTDRALAGLGADGVDLAIRHGLGRYRGLHCERLFAIELWPVAAPALARRLGRPAGAADFLGWPLVHDAGRQDWSMWLQAQGVAVAGRLAGPAFDDPALVRKAALAGHGAALLAAAWVEGDLAARRLRRLGVASWPAQFAYYLVAPSARPVRPQVAAFRDWVLDEARAEPRTELGLAAGG